MLKHVGKTDDGKKVVILFRRVPGEDHMCLVAYSDLLPRNFHDGLMSVVESPEGQATTDIASVLNRKYLPNGELILPSLHKNSFIRKIQSNRVSIFANPKSSIKLDVLNDMLDKMAAGGEAAETLAKVDASLGMKNGQNTPIAPARSLEEVEADNAKRHPAATQPLTASSDGVLSNEAIAANLLQQSAKMKSEATGLLAESARLEAEAKTLNPALVEVNITKTSAKSTTSKVKRLRKVKDSTVNSEVSK